MPLPLRPFVILAEHEYPGGPPVVDGFVLTDRDDYTMVSFRVDTGADRTTISPGDREALGIDLASLPLSDHVTITGGGVIWQREMVVSLGFWTLDGGLATARLAVDVASEEASDIEMPSMLGLDFIYLLNLAVAPTHTQLHGLAPYDAATNTYHLDEGAPS